MKLSHLPLRLVTGLFILNSGLSKRDVPDEAAAQMHGWAAGVYPHVADMEDQQFVKLLSTAEITLGVALLVPFVPASLVGLALTTFSGGLLGMYLKTPGMRKEGSLAPTQEGTALAKDLWMLGIGLSLLLDGGRDRAA